MGGGLVNFSFSFSLGVFVDRLEWQLFKQKVTFLDPGI